MKQLHKRLLIGLVLIVAILIIRFTGIHKHITLEAIRHNSEALQHYIEYAYLSSVLFFIGFLAIMVVCSIPVSSILTIASGSFFGILPGALYSVIGSTLGATIAFFTFRYLLRGSFEEKYGDKLKKFNEAFKKQGASYLLFMQLLPITPFGLITVVSGLSEVSWWTFVWTTVVGITPGSLIYAFAGRQLMTIKRASDILSWPIILALTGLALIALLPLLVRRFKAAVLD